MDRLKKFVLGACAALALAAAPSLALATDPVTISDVGVDVGAYVTAMSTKLGTGVAIIVGVIFAFMVIWALVRQARKATRG